MTDFDAGSFVKATLTIEPCANGGYLVMRQAPTNGLMRPFSQEAMAFSDWRDLMAFLQADYEAANRGAEEPPNELPNAHDPSKYPPEDWRKRNTASWLEKNAAKRAEDFT